MKFLFLRQHFTPFQQSSPTLFLSHACPNLCLYLVYVILKMTYHMMKMYML